MHILFIMEHLYPPIGGAERSVDTLIRALQGVEDIRVSHACCSNGELNSLLEEVVPSANIVVTQLNWAPAVIARAKKLGKKSIHFVRSYETFCRIAMDAFALSHCGQLCGKCNYRPELIEQADLLIANSRYTRRFLNEQFGLKSEIIYPFIDPAEIKAAQGERRFITMNQFIYHKGADIFIKIARRLPELDFRIVGTLGWMPEMEIPPNLHLAGPMEPKQFYSDTLLFLAPTRINETFGRSVVEAQMNGIPVLCSDRGGMKGDELVRAENRIEEIDDIDLWVRSIRRVIADYELECSLAESQDFSSYGLEVNVERFLSLVRGLA